MKGLLVNEEVLKKREASFGELNGIKCRITPQSGLLGGMGIHPLYPLYLTFFRGLHLLSNLIMTLTLVFGSQVGNRFQGHNPRHTFFPQLSLDHLESSYGYLSIGFQHSSKPYTSSFQPKDFIHFLYKKRHKIVKVTQVLVYLGIYSPIQSDQIAKTHDFKSFNT